MLLKSCRVKRIQYYSVFISSQNIELFFFIEEGCTPSGGRDRRWDGTAPPHWPLLYLAETLPLSRQRSPVLTEQRSEPALPLEDPLGRSSDSRLVTFICVPWPRSFMWLDVCSLSLSHTLSLLILSLGQVTLTQLHHDQEKDRRNWIRSKWAHLHQVLSGRRLGTCLL